MSTGHMYRWRRNTSIYLFLFDRYGKVAQVFVREGVSIGIISWVLSTLLALPLSKWLSDAIGELVMETPLSFDYSVNGLLFWFLLVAILSGLASFVPARNASRLTVQEVLAYE